MRKSKEEETKVKIGLKKLEMGKESLVYARLNFPRRRKTKTVNKIFNDNAQEPVLKISTSLLKGCVYGWKKLTKTASQHQGI